MSLVTRPTARYPDGQMEASATVEHPWAALEPPVPPYVVSDADRERWKRSQQVASTTLDQPPNTAAVIELTRTIYHDREAFPD